MTIVLKSRCSLHSCVRSFFQASARPEPYNSNSDWWRELHRRWAATVCAHTYENRKKISRTQLVSNDYLCNVDNSSKAQGTLLTKALSFTAQLMHQSAAECAMMSYCCQPDLSLQFFFVYCTSSGTPQAACHLKKLPKSTEQCLLETPYQQRRQLRKIPWWMEPCPLEPRRQLQGPSL